MHAHLSLRAAHRLALAVLVALPACALVSDADLAARLDLDRDGVPRPQDCDDADPGVGAEYVDVDRDGYGGATIAAGCDVTDAVSSRPDDCNDGDAQAFPGADERCNEQDDDCDTIVDEDATDEPAWYRDADADGYGAADTPLAACTQPDGYVADATDCDDTDPQVNPSVHCYPDDDGDSYGDPTRPFTVCDPAPSCLAVAGDCDDTRADVSPEGVEQCDALDADEDCDGAADNADADAIGTELYYLNGDGDGYAGAANTVALCDMTTDSFVEPGDCDDADPALTLAGCTWVSVEAGGRAACGVRSDGSAACWGDAAPTFDDPTAQVATLTADDPAVVCSRAMDGSLDCPVQGLLEDPPAGVYTSLTAGPYHMCALDSAAGVACWTIDYGGSDGLDYGEGDGIAGTFSAVAAGWFANCALDSGGAPTCWGNCISDEGPSYGVCDAPAAAYLQVDLGYHAGCGILPDRSAACWGYAADLVDGVQVDFAQPPAGEYEQLSMAWDTACGVLTTGAIACWGSGAASQSPEGTYTSVSVGFGFACGVTTEGAIECWGDNTYGQASAPDP